MGQMVSTLTDDVVVLLKGVSVNVMSGPILRQTGWRGGTFVQYVPPLNFIDNFMVEKSDGNRMAGILVFPSENYYEPWGATQNYIGRQYRIEQSAESGAGVVPMFLDYNQLLCLVFETVALNGAGVRAGGPAVYQLHDTLKVSENGYLCNDPDANLNAAGVITPQVVGICCAVPGPANGNRLGVDLRL